MEATKLERTARGEPETIEEKRLTGLLLPQRKCSALQVHIFGLGARVACY
jgi:hypothetical protein